MKKLVLIAVLVVFGLGVRGQLLEPVKWSYASKRVSATEAVVYVRASIEKGWHVYSTVQPDGGPVKTSFSFAGGKGYSVVGKVVESKPLSKFEKTFDMKVLYFDGSAVFSQKVRLVKGGKWPVVVRGKVEFMVCNDTECLPPSEVAFSVVVK